MATPYRLTAYVIPRKGATVTCEEHNAFLVKRNVAYYKLIERLEIVSDFTMMGEKVDKKLLAKDLN